MFVVSIFGGLGSQMDQYSFAMALQKYYPDTHIKFDVFNSYLSEHNGFELERVFGIHLDRADIGDIKILSDEYPRNARFANIMGKMYLLRRMIFGIKDSYIKPDDASAFYKDVFSLNPLKSYLFFGNWMHEKYREGVENEIKEVFSFPEFTDEKNLALSAEISTCNSVSIHVRHGDYAAYGFPIMSLAYYKKAIEIIEKQQVNLHYFIFSDDIEFVEKEFSFLKQYTIVDNNKGLDSYRDMQLMSLCHHNIIANSSFSYWAAYLNSYSDAIIIAPRYHEPSCKYPFAKSSWIILDNHEL